MMKRFLIPLVLILSACDASPPTAPPKPKAETDAEAAAKRNPNPVFETQIKAIEKAHAVEGEVMDAAAAQRKQVEDATTQ